MLIYGDDPRVKGERFIAEVNLYFGGAEANARRIVAAVNACAGVATSDLEEVDGHFGGVYADAKKRIAELTEQRDHYRNAFQAACAFIDSHAADPDLTNEMIENYRRFCDLREAIKAMEST
jgi:hypothetical protein